LFYPARLDASGRPSLSLPAYTEALAELPAEDLVAELVYEQLRLSYARRIKQEQLNTSFLFLGGLVIGIVSFGFLLTLGGILY
jgi:hypothetical protein